VAGSPAHCSACSAGGWGSWPARRYGLDDSDEGDETSYTDELFEEDVHVTARFGLSF
jgi:hypothetical protein